MSGRVAGGLERRYAGQDFLTPLVFRHPVRKPGEHLASIGEVALHHIAGGLRHVVVGHPEPPFGCRDLDPRLWKGERAVGFPQSVDMVAVKMGADPCIYRSRVDASRSYV